MKKFLLLCFSFVFVLSAWAQERVVSGKVTAAEDGSTLPGVNVVLKGTTNGTVTDVDGNYRLNVPATGGTLVYSFIGLLTQEVAIGERSVIDLQMETDVRQLSEVVVTALGLEVDKDKLGTATSSIGGSRLVNSGETGVLNGMIGKAAGINITQSGGDPGAGARIVIRGATSITGDLQPLIILDGIPMNNDQIADEASGTTAGVQQQSRLNDINPDDIESMEILKGASAAAIWGARAANGVIYITTKRGKSAKEGSWNVDFTSRFSIDELNKTLPLQDAYGQGARGIYGGVFLQGSTPNTTYGDRIADRPGGPDTFITDPNDPLYAGYFEAPDGRRFYRVPSGTPTNPNGGKNDRTLYDRYDPLFKNGTTVYNSVGIGTSSKNGNIYLSFSNTDQNGIIKTNSNYKRNTARLNATQVVNKLTFTTNVGYTKTVADRVQQGSNISGLFLGALRTPADFDNTAYVGTYYAPDGSVLTNRQRSYRNQLGQRFSSSYDNPLWLMENIINTTDVDRVNGKFEVGYDPLSWLNVTGRFGIDNFLDERNEFYPVQASTNLGGLYSKQAIRNNWFQSDIWARATFNVNEKISAIGLLGVGWSDRKRSDMGGISNNFINPIAPPNLNNAPADAQSGNSYKEQIRNMGYYGTLTVDMYDQLFVNLTGRYDYWSTFPENDNAFFYPAAEVAWQFSKVLPVSDFMSFGKLRLGYGTVGRAPDPYVTQTYYIQSTYTEGWGPQVAGGQYGGAFRRSGSRGNPNIKPETKTEIETGVDLRFLRDKLSFSATYYQNVTKDLIASIDVPNSTGFSTTITNGAEIQNKGIELELDGDILRTNDFTWNISANWFRNRNEVTKLVGVDFITISGFEGSASSAVLGEQFGVIYGERTERDANGNFVLDGVGFPQLAPTPGVLGDPNPDWRSGITNTFSYKGFSLRVLVERFQGGSMWNGTRGALTTLGMAATTGATTTLTAAQATSLLNYAGLTAAQQYPGYANPDGSYTVRGEVVDFGEGPVLVDERWWSSTGGGFGGPADQFMEDAAWTRIRELTISYSLPRAGFLNKTGIKRATISATGRNLVLWTNYSGIDPDTNLTGASNGFGLDYFNNPSTRSYQFTLNLNF